MKKCLLVNIVILFCICNCFYCVGQAPTGKNICPLKIELSEDDRDGNFEYGIHKSSETPYEMIEDVSFVKLNLMFTNSNFKNKRLEYRSPKDHTIFVPTREGNRGGNYDIQIRFGTYGLANYRETSIKIPEDVPWLTTPHHIDSISIVNMFTDLLTYNTNFIKSMEVVDPWLLILKKKKKEDGKKNVWQGPISGPSLDYYFILWDRSKTTELPAIAYSPIIESREEIKIKIPKVDKVLKRLVYVDISHIQNRKGLYRKLKSDFEKWESESIRFDLLISNGGEPYIGNNNNYKKPLKHIRLTETEQPIAKQDIEHLKKMIKKKKVFETHGVVEIHYYLSNLFYQTNILEEGERGKVPLPFITRLINKKDCRYLKIFIYIENEKQEFEKFSYECELSKK